jgi:hypothetical protein
MNDLLAALRKAESIIDRMFPRHVPADLAAKQRKPAPVPVVVPPKPANVFASAMALLRRG